MAYTIQSVEDCGNDILCVTAADDDGNTATATGWVSATTNHYDPDAYSTDPDTGNLVRDPDAKPRKMTKAEVGDYAQRLLVEQNPEVAPAPTPTPIAFS